MRKGNCLEGCIVGEQLFNVSILAENHEQVVVHVVVSELSKFYEGFEERNRR